MIKTKMWVQTEGGFLVLLALMLLVLPLQWVVAATVAAFFHECCHYLMIRLLGGRVYGLRLGMGGAKMEVEPLPPGKEMAAALVGPIGSALLILLARWMPRVAICGFVHCVFNLLPPFPLDGGRILRGFFSLLLPDGRGADAFERCQRIFSVAMGAVCLFAVFRWGIFPAVLGLALIWRQRRKRTV